MFPRSSNAVEIYGGAGTTGLELGVSQPLSDAIVARLDYNALKITRSFTSSDIDYDAELKSSNAGVYLDYFLVGGFRLTGGALIGRRNIHGTARSVGGTITLGGVVYPVAASDTLDFDARFPTTTPYLGIGYGHHVQAPGLHVYADAGVAYGRPKVTLSPSASLAAKVNASDLANEQASAQGQADGMRAYPVLKLGINYRF
ncbi:MAG: hypothetical protein ABI887_16505 [Burkholderiales bacterium]